MHSLRETEVKGKSVVVRIDCDVPLNAQGAITDDFRLRAALPTLNYLTEQGAKQIILVGHLGRPVGRPKERIQHTIAGNPRLSMEPVALRLRELLSEVSESLNQRQLGNLELPAYILRRGLYLLENIRFDWRELANDAELGAELAGLGEVYVFDAFATAHRAQASTEAALRASQQAVAGLRFAEEVDTLHKFFAEMSAPFVAILGGAKTETKLPVIERLIDRADYILLGGVMANTFAKSQGQDLKRSTIDTEQIARAVELYKEAPSKFILPDDYVWQNDKIMDIGPKTRERFKELIGSAKTIFWNGTLGVTSLSAQEFRFGTDDVARAIANNRQALSVVSGGDTVGTLNEANIDLAQYSFVSTGGGATLEYLANKPLPSLLALER